ncbi:hypothetical protein N9B72_02270, partial [Bacteriovoracaceae bacterium]|nr:hypothetical protein [Bacteriovoracaceae bacterium]
TLEQVTAVRSLSKPPNPVTYLRRIPDFSPDSYFYRCSDKQLCMILFIGTCASNTESNYKLGSHCELLFAK